MQEWHFAPWRSFGKWRYLSFSSTTCCQVLILLRMTLCNLHCIQVEPNTYDQTIVWKKLLYLLIRGFNFKQKRLYLGNFRAVKSFPKMIGESLYNNNHFNIVEICECHAKGWSYKLMMDPFLFFMHIAKRVHSTFQWELKKPENLHFRVSFLIWANPFSQV